MSRTVVVVNDQAIASLFDENSEIGRLTGRLMRQAKLTARAEGPRRSGRLVGSVEGYANRHYTYGRRMALYSDLYYARFVLGGTKWPIEAKHVTAKGNQGWMTVPVRKGSAYFMLRKRVRGQRANPFMQRALEQACQQAGIAVFLD